MLHAWSPLAAAEHLIYHPGNFLSRVVTRRDGNAENSQIGT
jgi:hypothetical protein